MSANTSISYTDYTWSPWRGCAPVSAGCANCYATAMSKRFGGPEYKRGASRVRTKYWSQPKRWNAILESRKDHPDEQITRRVFPSLCDWLDPEVPISWLADFLRLIHGTPNLTWLLLTKRPENFSKRLRAVLDLNWQRHEVLNCIHIWIADWQARSIPPANVWFGVTCENQNATERIPELLRIPAAVRWVSFEPLLEDLDCQSALGHNEGCGVERAQEGCLECGYLTKKIDWAVVGGESGPNRRDCGVDAIINVVEQCREAMVPVWVKQDCALRPGEQGRIPDEIWKIKELPKTKQKER